MDDSHFSARAAALYLLLSAGGGWVVYLLVYGTHLKMVSGRRRVDAAVSVVPLLCADCTVTALVAADGLLRWPTAVLPCASAMAVAVCAGGYSDFVGADE